jgi:SAM-dependent methyltransferase
MTVMSVASVFTAAMQGHACTVWEADRSPEPLPMHQWLGVAGGGDRALLEHCVGHTLDVGCGPGRMADSLARGGQPVLGIDVLPEAVRQTLARGVPALLRSVFDALPGEGRWGTVLLADGNIGIGGDPVALLDRRGHQARQPGDPTRPQRRVPVDDRRSRRGAGCRVRRRAGRGDVPPTR